MQNPRLLILFCLVPCLPAPPAPGQEATGARIPVPEAGKLRSSEAEVREVFKEDYASQDPRHRKPFAQKLLKNALETNDDPPIRYVLLKETAGQAARAEGQQKTKPQRGEKAGPEHARILASSRRGLSRTGAFRGAVPGPETASR